MAFRVKPGSTETRFWSKVNKTDTCWLWTGALSDFGHGQVRINKVLERAHRISWVWANGPIPEGMCVLHKCDVPACVNPDHLFLGTKLDNSRDMVTKGRSTKGRPGLRGSSAGISKFTESDVVIIRERYAQKSCTQYDLAAEYGVSQGTIGFILRRETWSHV